MCKIVVRRMQTADLPEVCKIEKENFSLPWSESSFFESMNKDYTIFLTALAENEVVGYIGCYCVGGEGEITNVAVKASHRRMGIGGMLLEKLYEEGKTLDTEAFFLEVRESNEAAIGLYTRQGFAKEGIRKNFYEKPVENAVIMWKHFPLGIEE